MSAPEHQVFAGETNFKVEQKMLAIAATYKIKDMHDNELLIAKRKMFSLLPKFTVERLDGSVSGTVKSNFWRTKWSLFDDMGNSLATIEFPFIKLFGKSFKIHTAEGTFNSGTSFFTKKFELYAPEGGYAYVVDKQLLKIRDTFNIHSYGRLSAFITCVSSIIIDEKFHQGN